MEDVQTGRPVEHEIAALVGPFWSEAKVCAQLDLTAETLAAWREAGAILGPVRGDGVPVFPVAQFHRHEGRVEVRPALLPLLQTLRDHDPWAVAVLLNTPAPELGGTTPVAWIADGGSTEAVKGLAGAVARDWAASGGRQVER